MQNAIIKNTALAAVLATGTMFTTVAQAASIEANVGFTTDYLWRGMTQNAEDSSFSGGIDISTDSGFYAGTWVGDINWDGASYELDLYGGYAGEALLLMMLAISSTCIRTKLLTLISAKSTSLWAQGQSQFHITTKLIMMTAQLIAVTIHTCRLTMAWISEMTGV